MILATSAIFTAGEALNRDRARGGDRTIIHKSHAILRAWLQRAAVASAVRIERELPNLLAEGDRGRKRLVFSGSQVKNISYPTDHRQKIFRTLPITGNKIFVLYRKWWGVANHIDYPLP